MRLVSKGTLEAKLLKYLDVNYGEVFYKASGQDCHEDLSNIDVANLDGDTILYMIFSRVRGERFSDGLFGSYVADGTMDKWLNRLKEIDEANQ